MALRVAHVVGGMNMGGVETWLMHVLRNIDRSKVKMDFIVHTENGCAYDDEIRSLGSQIIPCLHHKQPIIYGKAFLDIMRDYGPYDVVHSHVHHFSGFVLYLAMKAGIHVRIAHSHNDMLSNKSWLKSRTIYYHFMKTLIRRYATKGLANSKKSAEVLFGINWRDDHRWQILNYGFDFSHFEAVVNNVDVRNELGIPENALVAGHIGRFVDQKNHMFLLRIADAIVRENNRAIFLLVGEGFLKPAIESEANKLGIINNIYFLGGRSDIPRLMKGAMDVFVFPSLYEGLGIVLVEAQAAGLKCICSDVIPDEADVIKPLINRLSLSKSPGVWAHKIFEAYASPTTVTQEDALQRVRQSDFNILKCLDNLVRIYHEG